jgi:hypothetical protein
MVDKHNLIRKIRQSAVLPKFGGEDVTYTGILVVGRSSFLSDEDQSRLNWRSDKMVLNSVPILCLTFDELYERLDNRLKLFRPTHEVDK